jgi:hypothetical protein
LRTAKAIWQDISGEGIHGIKVCLNQNRSKVLKKQTKHSVLNGSATQQIYMTTFHFSSTRPTKDKLHIAYCSFHVTKGPHPTLLKKLSLKRGFFRTIERINSNNRYFFQNDPKQLQSAIDTKK